MAICCLVVDGFREMTELFQTPSDVVMKKLERVQCTVRAFRHVVVAFSGGVDSTVMASIAQEVLGCERVLAVTADSPSLAREDLLEAQRLARMLNLTHMTVATREVEDPVYQANTPQRCFVCKGELFAVLQDIATARGIPVIVYGAIGDDRGEDRPGQRAASLYQVRAPLQEAGFAKQEVRDVARHRGLANWNRPQNACLASRVPHGLPVTEHKLLQIESAERFLRQQGFRQVRVRHLGLRARIEVGSDETHRLDDEVMRRAVVRALTGIGFAGVEVDPRGYAAGGADRPAVAEPRILC